MTRSVLIVASILLLTACTGDFTATGKQTGQCTGNLTFSWFIEDDVLQIEVPLPDLECEPLEDSLLPTVTPTPE